MMEDQNSFSSWLQEYISMADNEQNACGNAEDVIVNRRQMERRHPRRWRFRRRYRRSNSNQNNGAPLTRSGTRSRTSSTVHRSTASLCSCPRGNIEEFRACQCGEAVTDVDWVWDIDMNSAAVTLNSDNREVKFHPEFSHGTVAVRGNQLMTNDQYYWEVKMTTPVYGTDMMIGIGTTEMDLLKYRYTYGSLLGSDSDSWALSYTGKIHHKGVTRMYTSRFGQGNIIGVHLDMWHGTLRFYKNRFPLGIAYDGLRGKALYPMVSSTSARSGMKVVRSCSFASSLQFLCCVKLRQMVPCNKSVLDVISMPPGLRSFLNNNLSWLLCLTNVKELKDKDVEGVTFELDIVSNRKCGFDDDDDNDLQLEPNYKRMCLQTVPFLI